MNISIVGKGDNWELAPKEGVWGVNDIINWRPVTLAFEMHDLDREEYRKLKKRSGPRHDKATINRLRKGFAAMFGFTFVDEEGLEAEMMTLFRENPDTTFSKEELCGFLNCNTIKLNSMLRKFKDQIKSEQPGTVWIYSLKKE